MHREHPLRIVRYSIKNIWLLTLPILRSIFTLRASPELFAGWLRGAWFDILILLLILAFGWMRWHCRRFSVVQGKIFVEDGLFFRRIRCFSFSQLSVLTLESPLWLKPVRACYVCADTHAGSAHKHDLRLLIRNADAELFRSPMPELRHTVHFSGRPQVHPLRIICFSLVFSSSLSGALYLAAFWFQGGRIARDLIAEFALVQRFDEASHIASSLSGIPPAAAGIGILILSMWLLSFLNNLLRYGKFLMQTDKRLLFVSSGIFTKRSFWLQTDKINFLDIRQNLLMKLCRVFSLTLNCPGYGSQRGTIPVCLPILTRRETLTTLPLLFTGAKPLQNQVRVPWTAWWGYVWAPVLGLTLVLPAAYLLVQIFPAVAEIIGFLRFMAVIPLCWKLLIQLTALATNGVALSDSHICLRYCKGFVFHTILTRKEHVAKLTITQYPWQRWFGKCNAVFYFRTEGKRRCMVKNISLSELHALMEGKMRDFPL